MHTTEMKYEDRRPDLLYSGGLNTVGGYKKQEIKAEDERQTVCFYKKSSL